MTPDDEDDRAMFAEIANSMVITRGVELVRQRRCGACGEMFTLGPERRFVAILGTMTCYLCPECGWSLAGQKDDGA